MQRLLLPSCAGSIITIINALLYSGRRAIPLPFITCSCYAFPLFIILAHCIPKPSDGDCMLAPAIGTDQLLFPQPATKHNY